MAESKKNYYEILGVDKKATADEIKAAYRKLAKQYHPDLHPGDAAAAEKFKEINEANETLSDAQKRAAYDYELEHPGMGGFGGGGFSGFGEGGGFGGFEDIFSSFFGGGGGGFSGFGGGGGTAQSKVGEDIQKEMTLSFMDAAKGCRKTISYMRNAPCETCKGTGAKDGTAYKTCSRCKACRTPYSGGRSGRACAPIAVAAAGLSPINAPIAKARAIHGKKPKLRSIFPRAWTTEVISENVAAGMPYRAERRAI